MSLESKGYSIEKSDKKPGSDRLAELRDEMMRATEDLVIALNKRSIIALAIAEEKKKRGTTQIRDFDREKQVLDYVEYCNTGPLSGDSVRRVIQVAMDVSSELQSQETGLPIGDCNSTGH